jgi:ADP-dependent phosphofructokinase/glucokinase
MGEKIALGFGDNTDYELIWDSKKIESLIIRWNIHQKDLSSKTKISTVRDLLISILQFMETEIGGECVTENSKVLSDFASNFSYNTTIGGTSPRAAIAMRKLGYTSCMHLVTVNDDIRRLLPSDCPYICSNKEDCADIHIIVQFTADTIVEANDISIHTSRANRIILDHDYYNCNMKLDPVFFDSYLNDARILLISGFNIMTDYKLLENRLRFLQERLHQLKTVNKDIYVYYEDACFADEVSNQMCKDFLFKYVDIFGFNEDELRGYYHDNIDLTDPHRILEAIETLYGRFSVPLLVVHSKYWAIAFGRNAASYQGCLKGGITMATTRFRFADTYGLSQYTETARLPEEEIGTAFCNEFNRIAAGKGLAVASLAVMEKNVTTIGLGDAFVGGFLPALCKEKN